VILDHPPLAALLAAGALATAGCNYSFHNPTDALAAGEVSGRATSLGSASPSTASVAVKGSLHEQPLRPSGRFGLLPLPRGPQTVLLRQGVARAAQRELTMGFGSDGQLEGLWLGDVALPRAVALAGTLFGPTATEETDGLVVDEVTGISVWTTAGGFRLQALAVGQHRILAATRAGGSAWIAGPALITVLPGEQGTEKRLADLELRPTTAATGHLYLRVASTVPGLSPAEVKVHVTDSTGAAVDAGTPDSNGDRDLTLPEGAYFVELEVPSTYAGTVPTPDRRAAVVVADGAFDLGTLTVADAATLDASLRSCHGDADCAPGTCDAGVCSGAYAPPALPPADVPVCADLTYCDTPGAACDLHGQLGGAGTGRCVVDTALGVCLPCSTRCSADGLDTRAASACSY
jgi:hypothetical protein